MVELIEIDPAVVGGKPVVRGTRIPVELLLRKLAEGATEADLLDAYPRLTREALRAVYSYAAETVAHEAIVGVGTTCARSPTRSAAPSTTK
jgi:uncharacterized protein (DUF433 family)